MGFKSEGKGGKSKGGFKGDCWICGKFSHSARCCAKGKGKGKGFQKGDYQDGAKGEYKSNGKSDQWHKGKGKSGKGWATAWNDWSKGGWGGKGKCMYSFEQNEEWPAMNYDIFAFDKKIPAASRIKQKDPVKLTNWQAPFKSVRNTGEKKLQISSKLDALKGEDENEDDAEEAAVATSVESADISASGISCPFL